MPDLTNGFQSLPSDYQQIIHLAQEKYNIRVAPLQLLVGGWSGAVVYLVSVAWEEAKRVEHCVLKLDRKSKNAKSDEVTRHKTLIEKAAPDFTRAHIAELVFDRVEQDGVIAIFYRIAGESLQKYRPLSNFERQSQLKAIFTETNRILLDEWNDRLTFEQAVHPQKILEKWLGFRLDEGGNIESFIQGKANANVAGFLVNGHVFPNPLLYARKTEPWGSARVIDVATGFIHGDLNTNNILVRFADDKVTLTGYYLIDFALFKENMPLLYDQRYLEMSYLMLALVQAAFPKFVSFLSLLAVADVPDPHKVPVEFSGVSAVIGSAREAFDDWVQVNHPSLHDDLWGQYWLAGVAAGLAYCHKAGQPDEQRLAGLIFAAANLKRFAADAKLPLPTRVELLYDESQALSGITRTLKHNLPAQPTPFIGRGVHLAALKERLLKPEVRLITLIGPGGTGKTRLSLQVAQEVLEHFSNGVFFIPLADDTEVSQFIARVAQQLEVREGGRPLLDNIKDYLRDKKMLLVLDNFEQLISAAPVVAELLAAAPQLKIITSSRVALKIQSEHEYPVPPLETPRREAVLDELAGTEAVQLFVERAVTARPNFSLTEENAAAVTEICRRLDGLPLALELAAARIKLLTPQAILARLDDQLKLLTGGARDQPARHQALRSTLEWSYSLLNAAEKTLYARLSVFVGGFTLEAAEVVCNTDNKLDILEGLTALADNSLLRQEEVNGEPRFGMLETIRAYAVERLAENGETPALQACHAHYFGNIISNQVMTGLYSDKASDWLNWSERELDNIRAALNWSTQNPPAISLSAVIVWVLTWFWYRRGYLSEGRMWTDKVISVLESQGESSRLLAMALGSSGFMAMWQGEQDLGLRRIQKGLAIVLQLEDELMVALITMGNGVVYLNMGRDREAQPLLQEAQAMFKQLNMSYFHALTTVHLGNVELGLGNIEQARKLHEQAKAEAELINENWLIAFALNNLGEVARVQGQYDLARKYYEECEALLPDSGDKGDAARFTHNLGYIAQHEGDAGRAASQFKKSLKLFRQLGNRRGMAECMAGLGGLKARQGQVEWGATMLSAADAVLKVTGGAWWPADRVEVEANQDFIRSVLNEEELAAAQIKGAAMSLEQALKFASEAE